MSAYSQVQIAFENEGARLQGHLSRQQVFDPNRKITHAHARRMINSVRNRWRNTRDSNLSDTARAEWIQCEIRIGEERDVDLRCIGMRGHDIVGEAAVDRGAGTAVVVCLLEYRHPDTH